jgi:hypothetical protein
VPVAFAACATLVSASVGGGQPRPVDEPGAIVAVFAHPSATAGARPQLLVTRPPRGLAVRLYRAGPERRYPHRDDVMAGVPVGRALHVAAGQVRLRTSAAWPSGLYFARLWAPGGRLGFAPVVLRAARPGRSRVLVVLPTNTWAAYNFRDMNGDGVGDTWYADPRITTVDVSRPFLDRGVPPHYRGYDAGFVRWLAHTHKRPDFLTDDDLERIASGRTLAARYDLVIFSGHEEYVTPHEYDVVLGFRNAGGNLAFLSANNFFYRVVRRGSRIVKLGKWRDVGRPEGALTGADYVTWFHNRWHNAPYVVTGVGRAPWLFSGTGLRDGSRFGSYGIEIDAKGPHSPPGTRVLARIPNVFGPGRSAEMTYYRTRAGAKVFSAGSINFGGSVQWPLQGRLMENLWRVLSRP